MRHVRDRLLDVPDDLLLSAGVEHVAALAQQRLQVLGDVAAGDVDALDAVGDGEALVHGHRVRHAVARVQHDARRPPGRVQRQHRLYGCVERRHVERLEQDLRRRVAVAPWVERRFCQEDGVLGRVHKISLDSGCTELVLASIGREVSPPHSASSVPRRIHIPRSSPCRPSP